MITAPSKPMLERRSRMAELSVAAAVGTTRYDGVELGKLAASLSSTVRRSDSSGVTKATTVRLKGTGGLAGSRQRAASCVLGQAETDAASAANATACMVRDAFMIDPPRFIWLELSGT